MSTKSLNKEALQVRASIKQIVDQAVKRFVDAGKPADKLSIEYLLTGEGKLHMDRLEAKLKAISKALEDSEGLTFSKRNGYPDFSHLNTSGTHFVMRRG